MSYSRIPSYYIDISILANTCNDISEELEWICQLLRASPFPFNREKWNNILFQVHSYHTKLHKFPFNF